MRLRTGQELIDHLDSCLGIVQVKQYLPLGQNLRGSTLMYRGLMQRLIECAESAFRKPSTVHTSISDVRDAPFLNMPLLKSPDDVGLQTEVHVNEQVPARHHVHSGDTEWSE